MEVATNPGIRIQHNRPLRHHYSHDRHRVRRRLLQTDCRRDHGRRHSPKEHYAKAELVYSSKYLCAWTAGSCYASWRCKGSFERGKGKGVSSYQMTLDWWRGEGS